MKLWWLQSLFSCDSDVGEEDAATSLRKRPLRLLSLVVGVVGTTAMWRKNPKMDTYLEEIHAYCNELTQCSELTTNPVAKAYIERLLLANCHGNLSYINLGILSILVEKRKNDDCSNFNVTCHHLQPRWWAFHHSIVDIGVWGKWRILEREMVNFDVNEDSLRDLLSS